MEELHIRFLELVFRLSPKVQELFLASTLSSTHTHTHTHTHIPWIHKYVTKTVECGASDKYTNIHDLQSAIYNKHFTKQYYRSQKTSYTQ